jgi:NAD-dependent SIR2 family protein deacetylase
VAACAPLCVLTGAGLSAASGIPTYRDAAGTWQRAAPVQASVFLRSDRARRRYWLRSLHGWPAFAAAAPNAGHAALAELERRGQVDTVITQNVDGLHRRAGTRALVELHGCLDSVACLGCDAEYPRADIQSRLENLNGALVSELAQRAALQLADGDAELEDDERDEVLARVRVPACTLCGGLLKPRVVFFGDSIPPAVWAATDAAIGRARGLLVVGSSLGVYSGLRICRRMHALGRPVAAINRGWTRADDLLAFKVDADAEAALTALLGAPPV